MSARVKAAKMAIDAAYQELDKAMKADYPVGKRIFYEKASNANQCYGEIILHGYKGSVRVKNLRTDKTYWLDSYWISGCRP